MKGERTQLRLGVHTNKTIKRNKFFKEHNLEKILAEDVDLPYKIRDFKVINESKNPEFKCYTCKK